MYWELNLTPLSLAALGWDPNTNHVDVEGTVFGFLLGCSGVIISFLNQ